MNNYDMSNSLDDFEEGDIIYIPETTNFNATICKFAPVEFEQNGGEQVFVTEMAIIKEGSNWNPYPDCEISYEEGCPVCLANEEQQEMLKSVFHKLQVESGLKAPIKQ